MIRGRPSKFSLKGNVGQAFVGDVDPIQAALNQFTFLAELKTNVLLQRGAGAASYTRATVATVTDFEGCIRNCVSGEVRFQNARRVYNLCPTPSSSIAIGGNKTITVTPGTYVFSMGAEATASCLITFTGTATGSTGTLTAHATNRTAKTLTITVGGTIIATCTVAAAADVQFENVTAQSNQAPGEYVSVGALSSPYHGAMVDGVKYFDTTNPNRVSSNVVYSDVATTPVEGYVNGSRTNGRPRYLPEGASTNLVLQSSNFGTTWVTVGTPTRSAAAAYCGDIALDLIGDDSAAAVEGYYQNITFTGDGAKAFSICVKQDSSSSSAVFLYDATASANRFVAAITWSNGAPVVTAITGSQERPPEPLSNGGWRLFFLSTAVTAANTNRIIFYPAADAGASVANTGNIYVGGVQAENATFASSHIPTTTGTATRNLDLETFPSAGNVSATAGTLYAEVLFDKSTGAQQTICDISDGTANERITLHRSSAGNITVDVVDGGVSQASLNLGALANGTVGKIAFRYAANDIAGSLNGAAVVSDTSATLPTVTTIYAGSQAGASQAQSPIGPVMIAQRKLSDAELITVTR